MSCTLQNDGVSQPAAARIHVHDGFYYGKELGSGDGIYYSMEWKHPPVPHVQGRHVPDGVPARRHPHR